MPTLISFLVVTAAEEAVAIKRVDDLPAQASRVADEFDRDLVPGAAS